MRPKAEWATDSGAMRARGITVLVKSNYRNWSKKNVETKHLSLIKARLFGRFSLLMGHNIQPTSSSNNQNAALIIDQSLDFTNNFYPKL